MFTSQRGDRWICQNRNCGSEIVVDAPSRVKEKTNPRCCCGSEMTKSYSAPTVKKLDRDEAEAFLQDPELSEEIRLNRSKHSEP